MKQSSEVTIKNIYAELKEIRQQLNTIISLFKLANSKLIEQTKSEVLKVDTRKKVYDLCDGTKTVKEIAQVVDPAKPLEKVQPLVSYHLSTLEISGLVSHRDEKGGRYYFKTLE